MRRLLSVPLRHRGAASADRAQGGHQRDDGGYRRLGPASADRRRSEAAMTPNWHVPPEISDPNELDAIAKEVNAEVLSNPSFEQVTGVSAELTVMHALRVVGAVPGDATGRHRGSSAGASSTCWASWWGSAGSAAKVSSHARQATSSRPGLGSHPRRSDGCRRQAVQRDPGVPPQPAPLAGQADGRLLPAPAPLRAHAVLRS